MLGRQSSDEGVAVDCERIWRMGVYLELFLELGRIWTWGDTTKVLFVFFVV